MKNFKIIIGAFVLIVGGIAIGMAIAYSPYGFPGTFGPPAPQEQNVIPVSVGELDARDQWLNDVSIYLAPLEGVRGNRTYCVLVLAPIQGKNININREHIFYLEADNLDVVQPIRITRDDFQPNNHISVKLIDEGPGSKEPYKNGRNFTLNSTDYTTRKLNEAANAGRIPMQR